MNQKDMVDCRFELLNNQEVANLEDASRKLVITRDCDNLLQLLRQNISPIDAATEERARNLWRRRGKELLASGEAHNALTVFHALYSHLLEYESSGIRAHKGKVLCQIGLCHERLSHSVLAKRYFMLALCEDAIEHSGMVLPNTLRSYEHLVHRLGLPPQLYRGYFEQVFRTWEGLEGDTSPLYPEEYLQELDDHWVMEIPSASESYIYKVNLHYVQRMVRGLGEPSGEALEKLAHYLVGALPGCRAYRRVKTQTSDLDVVGVMEGSMPDFRSDIGRYFICECKDWARPADVTTVIKFGDTVAMTGCQLGILFSPQGVSGNGATKDAERSILTQYQKNNVIIVVVDLRDLEHVMSGGNFITLIRYKYEQVKLDLMNRLAQASCR